MRLLFTVLLLVLTFPLAAQPATWEDSPPPRTEWHAKWQNSLAYTQEVLATVPDSALTFRPTAVQMSIQEQIQHLAGNIYGLSRHFLGHEPPSFKEDDLQKLLAAETLGRPELEELLTDAYAFGTDAVNGLSAEGWDKVVPNFFAGPRSRRTIIYLLQDHATHHRAQLLVYLRLLNLEPPAYRGW